MTKYENIIRIELMQTCAYRGSYITTAPERQGEYLARCADKDHTFWCVAYYNTERETWRNADPDNDYLLDVVYWLPLPPNHT